ncbi:MAG: hypothetical protein M3R53_08180 [Candidatus Eremiobacteraeota bacterium]|nr:hypothetical protein [Candidatus Eremiobacteraeota bacterium]
MESSQQIRQDVEFGVVKAARFEVAAIDGTTRAEIGTNEEGDPIFRMRDRSGTVRAVVSVQDDMPRVRLLDSSGQVRLCGILREDRPGLEFLGGDGLPRMVLYLSADENDAPDLFFSDKDGNPRFGVAMDRAGHITMAREDETGNVTEPQWTTPRLETEDGPLR